MGVALKKKKIYFAKVKDKYRHEGRGLYSQVPRNRGAVTRWEAPGLFTGPGSEGNTGPGSFSRAPRERQGGVSRPRTGWFAHGRQQVSCRFS